MACKFLLLASMAFSAAAEQVVCEVDSSTEGTVMIQKLDPDVTNAPLSVTEKAAESKPAEARSIPEPSLDKMGFDKINVRAALAEYIAMTLFIIIGCGNAMGCAEEPAWVLQVAFVFGFAITCLGYTVGAYSGGQINCAVTFGLVLSGMVSIAQGLCNFAAQMLGAVTGALVLRHIIPESMDKTESISSNAIMEGFTKVNALVGEAAMTFLLMFVFLMTAVDPLSKDNRALACIAIGFAVFLAHCVLIPIDGCSINPTRTFGTALISKISYKHSASFADMWVFWVGPLTGAGLAAAVFGALTS